ncbi:MAG: hypothetical protein MRK01_01630 [Candidatus Scalindua sp.]|nr:hypothetical protein [Candidatus Scalindua sp.]
MVTITETEEIAKEMSTADTFRELEKKESYLVSQAEKMNLRLIQAGIDLENSQQNLEVCLKNEKSRDLITVKDLQKAKADTDRARALVSDFAVVVENLRIAVANAGNALQQTRAAKQTALMKLFGKERDRILEEVQEKAGDLLSRYLLCLTVSNPGVNPSGVAVISNQYEALRILTNEDRRNKTDAILKDILSEKG